MRFALYDNGSQERRQFNTRDTSNGGWESVASVCARSLSVCVRSLIVTADLARGR
jgi:hypothetical protein